MVLKLVMAVVPRTSRCIGGYASTELRATLECRIGQLAATRPYWEMCESRSCCRGTCEQWWVVRSKVFMLRQSQAIIATKCSR